MCDTAALDPLETTQGSGQRCYKTCSYYRKADLTLVRYETRPSFPSEGSLDSNFTINMPFPFRFLCDLLNELDQNHTNKLTRTIQRLNTVVTWFNKHDQIIPRKGLEAIAFLSCLFPERRPDRVFNLQEKRLETIIHKLNVLGRPICRICGNGGS
jgi:hypothetical protein